MKRIGGNINGILERLTASQNAIGEPIKAWETAQTLHGFLDLLSETKTNQALSAFVSDSTHIFVCDYVQLPTGLTGDNSRFVCDGKTYQVEYIDNPMNLNYQLEIYLKLSGWQKNPPASILMLVILSL